MTKANKDKNEVIIKDDEKEASDKKKIPEQNNGNEIKLADEQDALAERLSNMI